MKKRWQNRVAESRWALPVTAMYALAVWVGCGLLVGEWWIQLACFAVSTLLMVELNNANALIRIYSRMVSCAFLVLSCVACWMLPDLSASVAQLGVIASWLLLMHTYQDKQAVGWTYYAFLMLGIVSLVFVQLFYLLPFIWLLTAIFLQSLSLRTFVASLLGLVTPYWIGMCWLIYRADFTPLADHFAQLAQLHFPYDYTLLSFNQVATLCFIVILLLTGTIHFVRNSYQDKIRIRMISYFFVWFTLLCILLLVLLPQHYNTLVRLIIVGTSPLIAHFIALTHTRVTNWVFYAIMATALLLTAYNLWTSSLLFS